MCETTQPRKTNTLTPKLSILYLSLLGVCLSAPFIYIGYNLFTNSTSGNRKNAKLLEDKQFELRKVTGAVAAYSSPVNKQVEISLFCTRHLIGWIWKCWNLLFQFCPVIGLHCLGGPSSSSRSVRCNKIFSLLCFDKTITIDPVTVFADTLKIKITH